MKILLYSSNIPYPLTEGGKVSQFTFLQELAAHKDKVKFVTLAVSESELRALADLKKVLPSLDIVNAAVNDNKSKKKFIQRIADFFSWQLEKKYAHLLPKNSLFENDYYMNPVPAKSFTFLQNLKNIIAEYKPDILQIDFVDNADIVAIADTSVKTIIVAHELKFIGLQHTAYTEGWSPWYIEYLLKQTKPLEIAWLKNYDAVQVFSNNDAARLRNEGVTNVYHCGFAVSSQMFCTGTDDPYPVDKLIFIGPANHQANVNAIEWYASAMADEVMQRFGLTLHVIGNWSDDKRKTFSANKGLNFKGYEQNLKEACKNSIMLVPLKIGSGIRTKILDALAMGVPVISTKLGFEGIGLNPGNEILIADNESGFLEAIDLLLKDGTVLQKIRKNGFQFVKANYSAQVIYDKKMEIFRQMLQKK